MSVNNPYANYAKNKVLTATGPELTLMLYDGAIKHTNLAVKAISENDLMQAGSEIVRIEKIIRELQLSLNMKYEISEQLMDLYAYIHSRLLAANLKKDIAILDEVKSLITQFRDTWREAMKIAKIEASAPSDNFNV